MGSWLRYEVHFDGNPMVENASPALKRFYRCCEVSHHRLPRSVGNLLLLSVNLEAGMCDDQKMCQPLLLALHRKYPREYEDIQEAIARVCII